MFATFANFTARTQPSTDQRQPSEHDELPASSSQVSDHRHRGVGRVGDTGLTEARSLIQPASGVPARSEEHTSELQSQSNLVCRLLLEKKKTIITDTSL